MNKFFSIKFPLVFLICTLLFFSTLAQSQVNLTSYHQFNQSSKIRFNPAMFDSEKTEIEFLNIDMGYHSNIKYSDIIHKGTGAYADSTVIDIPKFRSAIGSANHFSIASDFTLYRVSFKTGIPTEKNQFKKPHHISIAARFRTMFNTYFNDGFITLFTQGNAANYDRLLNGSLAQNATAMREISVGYGRKLGKNLRVGINLKYLQGYYNLTTNRFNLGVQGVDFENYIDVTSNAELLVSGPVSFTYNDYQIISDMDFSNPSMSISDMFFSSGNPGFAIDLGFVYEPIDGLVFSLSATDIGSIRWKQDTKIIAHNTTYRYIPADLSNSYDDTLIDYKKPEDVFDELTDEFKNSFKFHETNTAYTQTLPYQIYLGVQYELGTNFNAGLVYTSQQFNHFKQQLLATSLNMLILNTLSLSGNFVVDGSNNYIGLGGNLNIGALQISLALNSITAVKDPANANTASGQLGLKLRL